MRQEVTAIVEQLRGLKHEASYVLVVLLLRERLEHVKNQLVDETMSHEMARLQGRVQECRLLLHHLTGERVTRGLPAE